ncbi:unnamed protein product [Pedinophyceae sp. YPF-701]|nr:unnamed protein product [Pedinophyceae sp. YPF-701]
MARRRRGGTVDSGRSKRATPRHLDLGDIQCGRDGPLASIIRGLPVEARAALAATSSAMMAAVLESCDGARWWSGEVTRGGAVGQMVGRRLEGKVSEGASSLVGWTTTHRGPWMLFRYAAAHDMGAPSEVACVEAGRRRVTGRTYFAEPIQRGLKSAPVVTADMTGLQCIDVTMFRLDFVGLWGRDWLPAGVAAGIRELRVSCTRLRRVPEGLTSLEVLDVSECHFLEDDTFLPASSAAKVRVLLARGSMVRRIPEGMTALEEFELTNCRNLDELCLPASSALGLQVLNASFSRLRRLPAGMQALRELNMAGCLQLEVAPSGAAELRVLIAWGSGIRAVPEGLTALEYLDVRYCESLDVSSLRNAATVRVLCVNSAALHRLPEELTALQELALDGFPGNFTEDLIPGSIAARLVGLNVSKCKTLWRLPAGLTALERLDVSFCQQLDGESFLPASCTARLRWLRAAESNVAWLPIGMHALEELDVFNARDLEDTLELSVALRLRRRDFRGTGLVLPAGMPIIGIRV